LDCMIEVMCIVSALKREKKGGNKEVKEKRVSNGVPLSSMLLTGHNNPDRHHGRTPISGHQ